jgi:histidine triad (HIT) family protein
LSSCLFCRIVAGELLANQVVSTDRVYAFHDVKPVAPKHVLVVPREHIPDASHLGPQHGDLLAEMFSVAHQIAEWENIHVSGYRLVLNVGRDAGQTVDHLHLHVIGGRPMGWPPG